MIKADNHFFFKLKYKLLIMKQQYPYDNLITIKNFNLFNGMLHKIVIAFSTTLNNLQVETNVMIGQNFN